MSILHKKNYIVIIVLIVIVMVISAIAIYKNTNLIQSPMLSKRIFRDLDIVKVAVESNYVPFSYLDEQTGLRKGFDPEVTIAMCEQLKINCELVPMPFREILQALVDDKVQIAVAGFAKSAEREHVLAYSVPYYQSHSIFISDDRKVNKLRFADPEFLKTVRIGVKINTIHHSYMATIYKSHPENLKIYNNSKEQEEAFYNNEIDIIFIDGYPGYDILKRSTNHHIMPIPYSDPLIDSFSSAYITVAKKNQQYINDINEAINIIKNNGTYQNISLKYFPFLSI